MSELNAKSKARRKLTRTQVIDILERNVELYKGEEQFVRYLAELAIYLMEFEYNWADSDVPMPQLPQRSDERLPVTTPHSHSSPQIEKRANKVIVSMLTPTSQRSTKRHFCPFCGTEVGELIICPSCRNMAR